MSDRMGERFIEAQHYLERLDEILCILIVWSEGEETASGIMAGEARVLLQKVEKLLERASECAVLGANRT